MRPWWERSVAELAASEVPARHSPDLPSLGSDGGGTWGGPAGVVGASSTAEAPPAEPGVPVGDMIHEPDRGDILAAGEEPGDLSLPSSVPVGVGRLRAVGAVLGAVEADDGADADSADAGSDSGDAQEAMEH